MDKMFVGDICWYCKKHFYRDINDKEIRDGKVTFCSEECLYEDEFKFSKFIMKQYDYIPPLK